MSPFKYGLTCHIRNFCFEQTDHCLYRFHVRWWKKGPFYLSDVKNRTKIGVLGDFCGVFMNKLFFEFCENQKINGF